jgi:hypothetical protein
MKISNKSKISAITFVILLTISAILAALPAATAQEPVRTKAFAFINAMPDVVGINQWTLLHYGVHLPTMWPQTGWTGLTIEIERPDGETEILGPLETDPTGGAGISYLPTLVGTYRLRTVFPEQVATAPTRGFPIGTILEADTSDWFELTVNQEPSPIYPGHELPTEYWSRPINAQFYSWSEITGNWLDYARPTIEAPHHIPIRPGNSLAPETGHILWAKPLFGGAFSPLGGGLADVDTGTHAVEDGDAYEGLFTPPVIMSGVIYYNRFKADGGANVEQDVVAVDLRTGEELWVRDWGGKRLAFGQNFFFTGFNYHAVFQYLIATQGSTWYFYEPTTGRLVMTYENVPSGGNSERFYGPNGEIVILTIDLQHGWMTKWNSAWVLEAQKWIETPDGPDSTFGSWYRRYMGQTLDARIGIEWNVTIPSRADFGETTRTHNVQRVRYKDDVATILGCNFDRGSPTGEPPTIWAITFDPGWNQQWQNLEWVETSYSDELGFDGTVPQKAYDRNVELAWIINFESPMPFANLNIEEASMEEDVFTVAFNDDPTDWGFRLSTGEELWGPRGPWHYQTNWSYESSNSWNLLVGGLYLVGGHGGTLHALDSQTGVSVWNYTLVDEYNTYLFNNAWRFRIAVVTDGKIYLEHTEHSPYDPKPPAAPLVCLNLTTGERIWQINMRGTEWGSTMSMGDSILLRDNSYDQLVYAIGMGPSETTVTIQDNVIPLGSSVLVTGTVTDISAGTQDYAITARFPKGVPAVSDESMSPWMEYVYMQKERPTDTVGVQVELEAIDPNGEYAYLGTATTDTSGNYGFAFKPDVEGQYTILATFYGSKSYWGSTTTTYLTVDPAEESDLASVEGSVSNVEDSVSNLTTYILAILALVIIALVIAVYSMLKSSK